MEYVIKEKDMERVALGLLPALYKETVMYNDIVNKIKEYFSTPIVDECNKGNKESMEEVLAADYHHRLSNILKENLKDYAKRIDYSHIENLVRHKKWNELDVMFGLDSPADHDRNREDMKCRY